MSPASEQRPRRDATRGDYWAPFEHCTRTGLAWMHIGALAATHKDWAQPHVVGEGLQGLSAQVNDTLELGPVVISACTQICPPTSRVVAAIGTARRRRGAALGRLQMPGQADTVRPRRSVR